jgi:hypothetical protein
MSPAAEAMAKASQVANLAVLSDQIETASRHLFYIPISVEQFLLVLKR